MLKRFATSVIVAALCVTALAAPPSYEQVRKVADKALAQKDFGTAIREFERLIYLYPGRPDAHNALGYACYLDSRYEKAILEFKKALNLNPNLAPAQNNLMLAVGKRASEQAKDLEFSEAISLLTATENVYPNHPQAIVLRFSQGQLQFFRGNEEAGLKVWQSIANRVPTSGTARFIEAHKLYRQGNTKGAVVAMKAALDKLPNDPVVRNYMALILSDLGKNQEALAHLQKAEQPNPPYIDLFLNHTAILLKMGKLDEALAMAVKARDLRPDYASVHLRLAALYRQMGDEQNSKLALGRALSEQPQPVVFITGEVGKSVWVDQDYAGISPLGVFVNPGKHRVKTMSKGSAPVLQEFEVSLEQAALATLPTLTIETVDFPTVTPTLKAAPNFALRDQSNRFWRSFQHFHQRPVVLLFWNVDSDGNDETLRALSELGSRHGDKIACAVIHVGTEKKNAAIGQMMSLPATYARLFDEGTVSKRYALEPSKLPNVVVVDLNGYVASQGQGTAGIEQANAAINLLLGK